MLEEVREAPPARGRTRGRRRDRQPNAWRGCGSGVSDGATVEAGAVVIAVEAMKMEHSLRSPVVAGVVELLVGVGDQGEGRPTAGTDNREYGRTRS